MTDKELQQEIISVRTEDGHALDGLLVWNSQLTPRGATLSMHPDGSGLKHFELEPLARAGFMALRLKSRFAGNNATMIMEEIMLDIRPISPGLHCRRQTASSLPIPTWGDTSNSPNVSTPRSLTSLILTRRTRRWTCTTRQITILKMDR